MQIRAQFQLPDDLTEEEKLEPVRNFGDDPKIRLLNRLYEKKRRVCAACSAAVHCLFNLAQTVPEPRMLGKLCIISAMMQQCSCNTDPCTLILVLNMLTGTARACRR